jgi:nicotinamide-nucleotide amidase
MKAEIISIGTELLLGEITDTNTPYIASQLATLGIDLFYTSSVGDNRARLCGMLEQAWNRSDIIFTTGGLGPTAGDITRECIAKFLGEEQCVDEGIKQHLINFFAQRGLEMPQNNLKQAMLIPSCTALPNPNGTAPGWWVEKDRRIIVTMPGPPHEMQSMWKNQVLPRLQRKAGAIIVSRVVKTFGVSESKIDELLATYIAASNPTLATYAKLDGIYIRITAKANTPEEAKQTIDQREADVKAILSDAMWGYDEDTQGGVVGKLLADKKLTLAVAESFTAGYLTHTLATTPQSQKFFRGGVTGTSNEVKLTLGLDKKLVTGKASEAMAAAMATLVREKLGADVGIAIEGNVESTGADLTEVFIGIDSPYSRSPRVQTYSGKLYQMKTRAAYYALFELMKVLRGC